MKISVVMVSDLCNHLRERPWPTQLALECNDFWKQISPVCATSKARQHGGERERLPEHYNWTLIYIYMQGIQFSARWFSSRFSDSCGALQVALLFVLVCVTLKLTAWRPVSILHLLRRKWHRGSARLIFQTFWALNCRHCPSTQHRAVCIEQRGAFVTAQGLLAADGGFIPALRPLPSPVPRPTYHAHKPSEPRDAATPQPRPLPPPRATAPRRRSLPIGRCRGKEAAGGRLRGSSLPVCAAPLPGRRGTLGRRRLGSRRYRSGCGAAAAVRAA